MVARGGCWGQRQQGAGGRDGAAAYFHGITAAAGLGADRGWGQLEARAPRCPSPAPTQELPGTRLGSDSGCECSGSGSETEAHVTCKTKTPDLQIQTLLILTVMTSRTSYWASHTLWSLT